MISLSYTEKNALRIYSEQCIKKTLWTGLKIVSHGLLLRLTVIMQVDATKMIIVEKALKNT